MAVMGSRTQNQLIAFIVLCTLLFCVVIAFDLVPYLRGPAPYPPDWQWDYVYINTLSRIWMPLLFMGAAIYLAGYLEHTSDKNILKHEKKYLLIILFLFFFVQLSVTYFSRAGLSVLFSRIANPDMNGYFTVANTVQDIPVFLHEFNTHVLSLPMHAQGHPPGAILFFWVIEHILRPITPFFSSLENQNIAHGDVSILWRSLTLSEKVTALFSTFFIPFLASLSCVFIYYIGKHLYSVRIGMRAALLLLTIPSLILFIPINDVFLSIFPLASFLFFIKGIGKIQGQAWNDMVLSGFIFSLGLFFSLSLLPFLFIFAVYLFWARNIRKILMDGISFSFGFLLLPLILFLFFGYNTIEVSKTLLSGLPESRAYLTWVFFNLSDFFIFAGIPLFLFFCFLFVQNTQKIWIVISNVVRDPREISLRLLADRNDKYMIDPLTIGFVGMLLILDISGSVRGEVARIWIPFYPFLVIILVAFVTKQMKLGKKLFVWFLCLQFIQILVMQEFWVMLW